MTLNNFKQGPTKKEMNWFTAKTFHRKDGTKN